MAGFKAATAVEALDFDFNPYVNAQGVIPEPSTAQVSKFFNDLRQMMAELRKIQREKEAEAKAREAAAEAEPEVEAELTDEEIVDELASMDRLSEEYEIRLHAALAEVCQQTPTAEQIKALPYRLRQAFSAWIAEAFRPEGTTPASR